MWSMLFGSTFLLSANGGVFHVDPKFHHNQTVGSSMEGRFYVLVSFGPQILRIILTSGMILDCNVTQISFYFLARSTLPKFHLERLLSKELDQTSSDQPGGIRSLPPSADGSECRKRNSPFMQIVNLIITDASGCYEFMTPNYPNNYNSSPKRVAYKCSTVISFPTGTKPNFILDQNDFDVPSSAQCSKDKLIVRNIEEMGQTVDDAGTTDGEVIYCGTLTSGARFPAPNGNIEFEFRATKSGNGRGVRTLICFD
ncbi:hypothetical protein TCAL_09436 [Tigriopus californicus]|uniref:CUB domain-containing protein n=1 Tax=Tigriopus californicus TaxID=6832 RepID=A0A553PPC3_TIGCA|nr:hypothetical protein TCAL_09436 [Tigriopus californicus]|eukprot:TCALIF_09436-PA protein Name:"Protein of unknown function" AED:0.06 eAED:0.06 QI:7/0.5/0.66/1/0/0.33/3/140/254